MRTTFSHLPERLRNARAVATPTGIATSVVAVATRSERVAASRHSVDAKNAAYHRLDQAGGGKRSTVSSENDRGSTISDGAARKTSTSKAAQTAGLRHPTSFP